MLPCPGTATAARAGGGEEAAHLLERGQERVRAAWGPGVQEREPVVPCAAVLRGPGAAAAPGRGVQPGYLPNEAVSHTRGWVGPPGGAADFAAGKGVLVD